MQKFRRTGASRPPSRIVRAQSSQTRHVGESRVRISLVAIFFGLSFVMLGARLLEVSTMGGGDLPFKRLVAEPQLMLQHEEDVDASKIAEEQQVLRHEIVDRNGLVLATSIETASLVANPTIIRHEDEIAKSLHTIFPEESYESLKEKLMRKRSTFLYLRRHLSPKQQEAVNNLGVPGLFFEPDMRRVYPYGNLFAHTIGYVGIDNQGLAGIEKSFDEKLQDPVKNQPLQLSLDLRVQSIVRDELKHAVNEFNAIGATGIVLDIASGEIIAMTSLPDFDPHQPGHATDDARFNRATLGVYEMGSTFKTFTAAAALDKGTVTMRGGYDASQPIHYGNFTISDAHSEGRWLSVPEIFAYSSNIGAAKMALALGGKRQREFLKSLGLFDTVKLELPEVAHPIVPREWPELTTMTVSYGHGISVSPLHLVDAIAAVAGDGTLPPLTIIKGGNANKPRGPKIIADSTIENVHDLLRLVVRHGTGKSADAPGYEVGGKTGTAEKNTNGVYNHNAKVTSFVGVFPVSHPRYAMLVMLDEPRGNKETHGYATGGWISAPVVGRVVQRMGPLLGMKPDFVNAQDARIDGLWAEAQLRAKGAVAKRAHTEQEPEEEAATGGGVRATSF